MNRLIELSIVLLLACIPAAECAEIRTWTEHSTGYALVEDHRVPLVTLVVEIPLGTWSTWARINHAEEAFEIQIFDPAGDLRGRADQLGGDLRLSMRELTTRLELTVHQDVVTDAAALIRAVFGNRQLDRRELSRWQKGRVLTWEGSQRSPHAMLARTGARTLFAALDPRRLSWEKPRSVLDDQARLLEVRDLMLRLPGRLVGVAGDLDRAQAEKLTRSLLPPVTKLVPDGLKPALLPLTPARNRADQVVVMDRLTQTFFAWTRPSLDDTDPRWPAFLVADHVLGGHIFSRLHQSLRHSTGHTYGARSVNRGAEHVNLYSLNTATDAKQADEVKKILSQVLTTYQQHGMTEAERVAAVGYLRGQLLLKQETPLQQLNLVLEELRRGVPRGWKNELVERAASTELEAVNSFIGSFYDPTEFTMVQAVAD